MNPGRSSWIGCAATWRSSSPAAGVAGHNVWSADRNWQVAWYQDGARKGAMEPCRGRDPRAVSLYDGDEQTQKHRWVDAVVTDHLFAATPDAGAREVVVEATDGWGRSYCERMVL